MEGKEEEKKVIVKNESSSDDDAPLPVISALRKNRKKVLSDGDSDDDAPLASPKKKGKLAEEDSDDDAPLASPKKKGKLPEEGSDDEAPLSPPKKGEVKRRLSAPAKVKKQPVKKENASARGKGSPRVAVKAKAKAEPKRVKAAATKKAGTAVKRRATASGGKQNVKKEERVEGETPDIPGDARKYFKLGQKHITPPNGDGTRAFYESLYDENPNSLIALKFCVEYGVLTGTKHHAAFALFEALKYMGAYKGPPGGIRKEFVDGPPKNILAKFERAH
eukprot:GHVS01012026.1.p1 GENE.GHVS01012026.1~~GHVS01012026.1.p1  ORF type:complete len:277 (+),score=57.53 GHVS01012026.1:1-831(+)